MNAGLYGEFGEYSKYQIRLEQTQMMILINYGHMMARLIDCLID